MNLNQEGQNLMVTDWFIDRLEVYMENQEIIELRRWSVKLIGFTEENKHTDWLGKPYYYYSNGLYRYRVEDSPNDDPRYKPNLWCPDVTASSQIWEVVEKVRELGFTLHFITSDKYVVRVVKVRGIDSGWVGHDNPCLAILLAARAALGGEG